MNVIMTHRESGYQETGELKWQTLDCYVVHKPDGTDVLYPMKDWECEEEIEKAAPGLQS